MGDKGAGKTGRSASLDNLMRALHSAAQAFDRSPISPHFVANALLSGHLGTKRRIRQKIRKAKATQPPMTWDELSDELDAYRADEPAWVDVARTVREWKLGRLTWKARMGLQLAQKGWCDQDAWNLDYVLCTRLAGQLESLADQLHGWPGTDEFPTPEDWEKALRDAARDLRRVHGSPETSAALDAWIARTGDTEEAQEAYQRYVALDTADHEAVTRALRWVADHHGHLWD